jgi:hypothetical protein
MEKLATGHTGTLLIWFVGNRQLASTTLPVARKLGLSNPKYCRYLGLANVVKISGCGRYWACIYTMKNEFFLKHVLPKVLPLTPHKRTHLS